MARIERREPLSLRRKDGLLQHARENVFSQNGEDGILAFVFATILPPQPGVTRWCVDVGAWDGKHLSNTHRLLCVSANDSNPEGGGEHTDDGGGGGAVPVVGEWRGLLVEADGERIHAAEVMYAKLGRPQRCVHATAGLTGETGIDVLIKTNAPEIPSSVDKVDVAESLVGARRGGVAATEGERHDDDMHSNSRVAGPIAMAVATASGDTAGASTSTSTSSTTDGQCAATPSAAEFALLSIDVDGVDYWLWDAMKDYAPSVVVIEFNPTIPNHILFVQPRDDGVQQGSSLLALAELAEAKGYRLVETTLYNGFFVRADLWPAFAPFLPMNGDGLTLDHLHQPTMTTDLWQLYDGTLCIAGCKKLLWHRVGMDINKMQVLPKSKRVFPFAPGSGVPPAAR